MASRAPGVPVRRITVDSGHVTPGRWPWDIPAVRQLASDGLDLDPGITVLVGANGSGKSTLVEAVAGCWGRQMSRIRSDWMQRASSTPSAEDSQLHLSLRLHTTPGGPNGGLFLRAERMHAQAGGFSERGRWSERIGATPLLERSHGEGFLAVLHGMTHEQGLYVLDEPESALSFDSSLALLQVMVDMREAGSQIVLATHSPVLAAVPGARLLQLDGGGITEIAYDDSDLVSSWRSFLASPERFLRHLATDGD